MSIYKQVYRYEISIWVEIVWLVGCNKRHNVQYIQMVIRRLSLCLDLFSDGDIHHPLHNLSYNNLEKINLVFYLY